MIRAERGSGVLDCRGFCELRGCWPDAGRFRGENRPSARGHGAPVWCSLGRGRCGLAFRSVILGVYRPHL